MSSGAIARLNQNAECVSLPPQFAQPPLTRRRVAGPGTALRMNITSARGLQNVLATNLGPKGTLKMCVLAAFPAAP